MGLSRLHTEFGAALTWMFILIYNYTIVQYKLRIMYYYMPLLTLIWNTCCEIMAHY